VKCEDVRRDMQDEIDGLLHGERSAELRAHLASCPVCAEEFRALEVIDAALLSDPLVPAPPSLTNSVMAGLERRADARSRLERTAMWIGVPLGALSAALGMRAVLVGSGASTRVAGFASNVSGDIRNVLAGIAATPELSSPGVHGFVLAIGAVALSFLVITALRMYKHQTVEWI
jgi:anti-sigma factor RsiW